MAAGLQGRIRAALAALVLLLPLQVFAAFSIGDVTSPGGFITSYAGIGGGFTPGTGLDQSGVYSSLATDETLFTAAVPGFAAIGYSDAIATNSANGYASFGALGFSASNNGANSHFSQGQVNGGWTDSLTITSPGLNGQAGVWLAPVDVSGFMQVAGFAGSASFVVQAFIDGQGLKKSDAPGFDQGGSDPLATDFQLARWGVSSFGSHASRTVTGDTVTFAIPIVFGQSFDLGIYALATAGMRSSSGVPGNSTASTDFLNTLLWGGGGTVLHGGSPVGAFSIGSASGTDWAVAGAPVPLPAPLLLLGCACALLLVRPRV